MEAGKSYYALITPLEKEFSPVRPGQPGVRPSNPIAGVGTPENPIVIPPNAVGPGSPEDPIWLPAIPDNTLPGRPGAVFPPGLPPMPGNPIALPPTDGLPPLVPTNPIVVPPNGTLPVAPEGAEKGADAVVVLLPPSKMAPPAGTPPDYQAAVLWYGPGSLPVQIWVPPETAHKYKEKEHKGKKAKGTEEQDEREAEARYRGGSK